MFYKRLLELCESTGKKPTPILKEMGISSGNLERWKENEDSVTIKTLKKIASYFNVSISYLIGEDNNNMTVNQKNVKNEHTNICYNQNNKNELDINEEELINIYRELGKRKKLKLIDKAYELKEEECQ